MKAQHQAYIVISGIVLALIIGAVDLGARIVALVVGW